jgi:thiamine biosynthesis lipoprotein
MSPAPVMLALHAMATRFELVLHGDDPVHLRAAGEEALAEIDRIERLLSAYRPDSDIGRINRDAAWQPVRVTAETCRVLRQCLALAVATDGAFDVTVGPLVRTWRTAGERGILPSTESVGAAREAVGIDHVQVDEDALTVALERPGMAIDLGAAGKGYAIDQAVRALIDAGITSALLHGGTSSVHAIGAPPAREGWPIRWDGPGGTIDLRDEALSVSASSGRTFTADGQMFGHVIDPRTGAPVDHTRAAGVRGPSSFLCDGLSTALLVRGGEWLPELRQSWPDYDAWTTSRKQPTTGPPT